MNGKCNLMKAWGITEFYSILIDANYKNFREGIDTK